MDRTGPVGALQRKTERRNALGMTGSSGRVYSAGFGGTDRYAYQNPDDDIPRMDVERIRGKSARQNNNQAHVGDALSEPVLFVVTARSPGASHGCDANGQEQSQ